MTLDLPRAAIFDWDNTLVDSWEAIMLSMNRTFEHFGKPSWTLEEIRSRCKYAAKDYFPALFGEDWEKAFDVYYRHFNAVRADHGAKPRPGAADLLRWLKDREIPAFVVSNKRGDYLRQEAATLQWNEFFVALIGSNDAPHSKPARDPVDMALNQIGFVSGPSVWFIGDTDVDMQCAHNSGCTPVFVGDRHEAEKLSIALAFADCGVLHNLLNERWRNSLQGIYPP